ncbi:MAG: hypothetical protein FJ271_27010 [Planctomycetes bacterium]|nr:hypothetical protein [Planctomycetota bacterium]
MANETSQPGLAGLAARYLNQQLHAEALGLGRHDSASEVELFEAGPVQAIDPRPAWQGANVVLPFFAAAAPVRVPACWGQLVAAQEPAVALAFCAGNYPQLMRDWHLLLHHDKLADLCPQPAAPLSIDLEEWIKPMRAAAAFPDVILALGCLRLARQFESAGDLLKTVKVPAPWRGAWANEAAAIDWHQGKHGDALAAWNKQEASVPVLFNRGMSSLFLGKKKQAEDAFLQANSRLPESSSWYHLGQLYLTFARL